MLDAALKALEQLLAPPFRAVLLKSISLALVLLLALGVGLHRLMAWLIGGIGAIIFFIATAFLLGRVYFELAAMRFHPVAEAKRLRKARQGSVFLAGLLIAAFVSIPIVNLATPLFGMALMVHMHKRLTSPRGSLFESAR